MSLPVVALIVFLCVLNGIAARPDDHRSPDSKDVVKLGIGMIATMTVLILGMMTSSAKSAFDGVDAAVMHTAISVLALDRMLAAYGPETKAVRDLLRRAIEFRLDASWPEDRSHAARMDTPEATPVVEGIERQIVDLSPQSEAERWLKSQALALTSMALLTRWAFFGASDSSMSLVFLVVVLLWLALIFRSFGLFAPRNATVTQW